MPSIERLVLLVFQVRRRVTADEVDIKDLEAAVRGEGVESPRQEIARLRRQVEPEHYDLDLNKEVEVTWQHCTAIKQQFCVIFFSNFLVV